MTARSLANPIPVAVAALVALTALGWATLFADAMSRGSGMQAFMEALCAPADIMGARSASEALSRLAASIGMWMAMSVAMMLPTASLLIVGFADRLEERAARGLRRATPLALGAGYLAVWIGVAIMAAIAQAGASAAFSAIEIPPRETTIIAGVVIGAAGFYQFSGFKHACLLLLRNPFTAKTEEAFSSNAAAFRLGASQGATCVGCCWAMMGLLVVVGAMNLVWMAIFAIVMATEKMTDLAAFPKLVGAAMIGAGAALSVSAVGLDAIRSAIFG
ncbi:MAG: DUF2182 domain-containing protein [Salinarimonadaceae bacterium]|nr:MAG: DUF2182 domain-containing protein [Salinarimonadaceae bacterium]